MFHFIFQSRHYIQSTESSQSKGQKELDERGRHLGINQLISRWKLKSKFLTVDGSTKTNSWDLLKRHLSIWSEFEHALA